jgi:hypothetical protein
MATLAESLAEYMSTAGMETHVTAPTFRSFGNFIPLPTGDLSRPPGDVARPQGDNPSPAGDPQRPPGDVASPAGGGPSPAGGGPSPARDHHRYSRLDQVYTKGLFYESVVIPDSTTDHRPVVTTVRAGSHGPGGATKQVSLKRGNFKAITRQDLEGALNLTNWSKVYDIRDVDAVLDYITAGIDSALNIVAPENEIQVKKGPNLYLTRETLEAMRKRDSATGKRYRNLWNEVSRLVRRDKQDSNLLSLTKANNDPKVLWSLADEALRKDRPSLPASITGANGPTTTFMEAAEVMNKFFVDKVDDLRKKALLPRADAHVTATTLRPCLVEHGVAHVTATKLPTPMSRRSRPRVPEDAPEVPEEVPDVAGDVPHVRQDACQVPQEVGNVAQEVKDVRQKVNDVWQGPTDNDVTSRRYVHNVPKFLFKFANAKKTTKTIRGLNNREALGVDNIPTSVLKKGVEVLAGPVAQLINMSLAEGKVPAQFKIGRVHPIHKGKGKPREDPASYRPVSILPALSKVMETHMKEDLEGHLGKVNGLPGSQYGFRPKTSCTSPLAQAQAGWMLGAAKGQVEGLMAFDLRAAFDTVAAEQLSPTLQALGVTGRELRWFLCYMTGGRQSVVWDGTVSSLMNVLYSVRQGSILGPLLFIILTSGMAEVLGVKEEENIIYADDSNVWQTGNNKEEVVRKLAEKAAHFVEYTRSMGLSMNAAKTQLLFSSHAGNVSETKVEVDGNTIHPGNVIELLGVRYDRKLSTTLQIKTLLAAVRQRASVVARLTNHLPGGRTCGICPTGWSWENSPTHWRLWQGRGWSTRTTRPSPEARSRWPLMMWPGASPAHGGVTTSPSRTCSSWPGSGAQTGWW